MSTTNPVPISNSPDNTLVEKCCFYQLISSLILILVLGPSPFLDGLEYYKNTTTGLLSPSIYTFLHKNWDRYFGSRFM